MRISRARLPLSVTAALLAGLTLVPSVSEAATSYTFDRTLPSPIVESSGLAYSTRTAGLLWTHEDGGRPNRVYAVNPNGSLKSTVTLTGAKNVDWEDIEAGPSNTIWVSDTGDNNLTRTSVQVYKFTEPTATALQSSMSVTATKYTLTFPDGAKNVEALLVDPTTGRLYLVSKTTDGTAGAIYQAPTTLSTSSSNKLTKLGSAPAGVTSGSWAPNGASFALGTRTQAYMYAGIGATPTVVGLPTELKQAESLAISTDSSTMYVGSEGASSPVYRSALPSATVANVAPVAAFTATATNLTANLDASKSSDTDGTVASYAWTFGDGTTGAGKTVSHTYATSGTKSVKLTVTDDRGATNSVTTSVTVTSAAGNTAPTAAFSSSATDLVASFDASASADADGTIASYAWTFGDGSTGTGKTTNHTYLSAGTKTVSLTVTDDRGASQSVTKTVTVTAPVTPPGTITLTDGSVMNARGIMTASTHGVLVGGTYGSNSDPQPWEDQVGRNLGVSRRFYTSSQVSSAVSAAQDAVAHKRVPWISFKLPYTWEEMAAGKGDAWTLDLVKKLDAVGGPVYLAFHHEPEGDGNIAAWKQMQEHLGPIVRNNSDSVAYTVVLTGWHQLYGDAQYRLDNMMPNTKVDMLGVDVYEKYGTNNSSGAMITSWTNFDTGYYKPISEWAAAHNMAWGIAETGYDDDAHAVNPNWISQNIALAKKYNAQAWAYFNTGLNNLASGSAWALETSGEQAAFKTGITGTASLR
jgi:PKD repeat protein